MYNFHLCRGEEFRKEYSRLGEVRSILPHNVHVMALTATATKTLRRDVYDVLGMENPVLVSVSPDKDNIKYVVAGFLTMDKAFGPIADQLYESHTLFGRTIIFCQKLDDCCKLYRYFRQKLGDHFTVPHGSQDLCRNRVVDMFHRTMYQRLHYQKFLNSISSLYRNSYHRIRYGCGHP